MKADCGIYCIWHREAEDCLQNKLEWHVKESLRCRVYYIWHGKVTARDGNHLWPLRQAEHAESRRSMYLWNFGNYSHIRTQKTTIWMMAHLYALLHQCHIKCLFPQNFLWGSEQYSHLWPGLDCNVGGSASESYNLTQQTEFWFVWHHGEVLLLSIFHVFAWWTSSKPLVIST
jgi:hypothetical protein